MKSMIALISRIERPEEVEKTLRRQECEDRVRLAYENLITSVRELLPYARDFVDSPHEECEAENRCKAIIVFAEKALQDARLK